MFLIMINYKQPIEVIEKYLTEHRVFLDKCYKNNYFIVAGPRNPRTGGIIISQLKNRTLLDEVLREDPFMINNLVYCEIIEFIPVKYHRNFSVFIEG